MTQAVKTPLAKSLPAVARAGAQDATHLLGKGLPCSVTEVVSSGIVKVKLEVTADPWTLPELTVPVRAFEYIRYPVQVGDKGVLTASDARLGGLTGLGAGAPLLTDKPANLSALSFSPLGSTEWADPIDPDATEIYGVGSSGAILRDGDSTNIVTVDGDGFNGNVTGMGWFGNDPVAQQSITGALSLVTDSNAKAVLISIIDALSTYGLVTDDTT